MNRTVAALCVVAAVTVATPAFPGPQPTAAVSSIFGVAIPEGYRSWNLVGVAQESGDLDELRAVLANPVAMEAYRACTLPFPDGSVLVKLAWKRQQSVEFAPAFVPGTPTTVQVMVMDQARYAATGGWGFGRFVGGEPADEAQHHTCFACHSANVRDHDFVFTRLAR
jgi:hypothetical protein